MFKKSLILSAMLAATSVACGAAVDTESTGDSEQSSEAAARLSYGYLSLGDSVPFGMNPFVDRTVESNFVGYPQLIESYSRGIVKLTAPTCPGESTASFIDRTAPDNGCLWWRTNGGALHDNYASNSQSQLQYAKTFLKANPGTKAVTLQIGANDLLMLANKCSEDPATFAQCAQAGLPAAIGGATQNVMAILQSLRTPNAAEKYPGYAGDIVFVNYHALNYNPAPTDVVGQVNLAGIVNLNKAITDTIAQYPALKVKVADGFSLFQKGSESSGGDACKAGLLIPDPTVPGTCNFHPSKKGADLFVQALAKLYIPNCN